MQMMMAVLWLYLAVQIANLLIILSIHMYQFHMHMVEQCVQEYILKLKIANLLIQQ